MPAFYRCLVGLLLLASSGARADVLVLVHGYLGDLRSWEVSGVTSTLQAHGWQRAGIAASLPGGQVVMSHTARQSKHKFYTVDLPSEAPILFQTEQLHQLLTAIGRRHPDEAVILAGHSAGGIVARALLARRDAPPVKALITIASPHMGTGRAAQALSVTDTPFPFRLIPEFFGGGTFDTLERSRHLYLDLLPPAPGTFLDWLNRQPLPDIRYVAIVHGYPLAPWGDSIAPGFSQDMNRIPTLAGKADVVTVPADHFLTPADGEVLLWALEQNEG